MDTKIHHYNLLDSRSQCLSKRKVAAAAAAAAAAFTWQQMCKCPLKYSWQQVGS